MCYLLIHLCFCTKIALNIGNLSLFAYELKQKKICNFQKYCTTNMFKNKIIII